MPRETLWPHPNAPTKLQVKIFEPTRDSKLESSKKINQIFSFCNYNIIFRISRIYGHVITELQSFFKFKICVIQTVDNEVGAHAHGNWSGLVGLLHRDVNTFCMFFKLSLIVLMN